MAVQEHMTPRERVLCSIRHEVPDRTPLHFKAEKETWQKLCKHFQVDTNDAVMDQMGLDVRPVYPNYVGPQPKVFDDGSFIDPWGTHRKIVQHAYGTYYEYAGHPLAGVETVEDLDRIDYDWPSPDWWDVSTIPAQIDRINSSTEYCILLEAAGMFEWAWGLRGLERFLTDMARCPEIPTAIMTRLTDTAITVTRQALEAARGRIDIVWTWDDVATQNGPMMSPRMWEKLVKPHHIRLNNMLREYRGVTIMYHSCGSVTRFIDGFIDMGVEILNPLQPRAADMDLAHIKQTYGDRLAFHGAIDIQHTLPYGSRDDVIAEVRDRINVLGAGGGYILAPAHLIQADTSVENILAMCEAARTTQVPSK